MNLIDVNGAFDGGSLEAAHERLRKDVVYVVDIVPFVVGDFQSVADPGHAALVRRQTGDVNAM